MTLPIIEHFSAYEVRHFIQPAALKAGDEIALLNEYIMSEVEEAMIKDPAGMKAHLISMYRYINTKPKVVNPNSVDIFDYPFLHMTGHGNVFFTQEESENLRNYLLSGGFIHIDDNYGMDEYLRKELIKIFPNKELIELSKNHPIFKNPYNFPQGLPKIHEHDKNRPQAFGIFEENRLLVLYTFESDLGDGWENPEIHNDPQETRLKALQMGANIINYVFIN